MAKSDTKSVRMLDTVEKSYNIIGQDERGKPKLINRQVRLQADQRYDDLPDFVADELIADGFAEAVKP